MAEVIDPALATAGKPLELGQDPTKYLERFDLWYNHTSLLADSICVKGKQQKLRLTLLWGGYSFTIKQFLFRKPTSQYVYILGKYSVRRQRGRNQDTIRPKCPNCPQNLCRM